MARSSIEWTEYSWNPVTGCTKISSGCLNCYAERMAKRLQAMGIHRYTDGFEVRIHADQLAVPLKLKKPRVIFVNSMGDLFHEAVPDHFILKVFDIMNNCPRHIFQILTKRSDRLLRISDDLKWTENIWMGVTIEDQKSLHRINELLGSNAKVKFVSCEPLLEQISFLNIKDIDWIIVGGESGPGARPMKKEWATSIRDQCQKYGVAFFFKQWGGNNRKAAGRILEGVIWEQKPASFAS
jgi:protein gp37